MKKTRMIFLGFMVLALFAGTVIVRNAEAEVRISATLYTPNVHLRIGNAPVSPYAGFMTGPLPVRRHYYEVTAHDRNIARRLARYTGVPVRRLILLRGYGYNWFGIGGWLHLPRPAVHAAMRQQSWNRFLREQKLLAGRAVYRYKQLR